MTSRYSIVDSSVYLCWALMDYILIGFVSSRYGDSGLITLAVVVSLIEFGVVLDGVGMAMQPLIGTYFGEKNHRLIKRVMKSGIKAALIQGAAATTLICIFAKQFCGLFGITGGAALEPSVAAVRIASFGFTFVSAISLMTSYYMLVDRVGLAVGVTFLKDGILYSVLPVLGSLVFGKNGMWAAFAVAPVVALIIAMIFIRWHYGKAQFPDLLIPKHTDITVLENILSLDKCSELSEQVQKIMLEHEYSVFFQ